MPQYGLVIDTDNSIASWTWHTFNILPIPTNFVYGIRDTDTNDFVGSAMFYNYNGYNIEFNYYGSGVLTPGMVKLFARELLQTSILRVTVRQETTNIRATKATKKFGFKVEGYEEHFYGPDKHCVRLVLFRDGIEKLAGIKKVLH